MFANPERRRYILRFNISGFAAYSRAVSAVIRFSLYRVNRPESIETKKPPAIGPDYDILDVMSW